MPTLRHNAPLARSLRESGKAATRQENDALIGRVRAKDPQAIKRMIEGNSALVIKKCRAFLRSRPKLGHLADDMVSAGFVALSEAVNRLAEAGPTDKENVTGYLSICINGAFKSFSDSPICLSHGTRWRKQAAGEQLPQAVELSDDVEPAYDPNRLAELWEEIEAACISEDHLTIVRMRFQGYTDKEIGETIGKSKTTVFTARKAIEARFDARQKQN